MDYDRDKVDEAVLALLYLTMHGDSYGNRAWKGHDWDALGRLDEKGYIGNPVGKAKSVVMKPTLASRSRRSCSRKFSESRR
jgi:hypothetical protein